MRCACRTSASPRRARSCSTSTQAPRSTRATRRCRSCPPRTRSSPSPMRRSRRSAPPSRSRPTCSAKASRRAATWQGDLVLKGYGDPTLSSADLTALARQVRAERHHRVSGRVLGDESWFDAHRTAPGWKAAFYINESPPLSALIVDRGRVGRFTSHNPGARRGAALPQRARARGRPRRRRAAHGAADDAACRSARSTRRRSRDRPLDGPGERQLHGRDAREGARRRAGRPGRRRPGVGVDHAACSRRPASRSRASGSSTARASRCSTG